MPELRSVRELSSWLENPITETFPYDLVVDDYLRVGKHFVAKELLDALLDARVRLGDNAGTAGELRCFLDVALDKRDERYDYTSYLALRLLPLPDATDTTLTETRAQERHDRLFAHLIADIVRFEMAVLDGRTTLLPQMRPDPPTIIKRLRLASRAARPALDRLGLVGTGSPVTAEADTDPVTAARHLFATIDADTSGSERRALRLSMLPVWVAHDEYMFIRVLQAFETTFALLAVRLSAAVTALDAGQPAVAIAAVDAAEQSLTQASRVFSVMATMQVESFLTFRDYTEGASAIQSRNYKIVESLCTSPERSRLDSAAYLSVPEVRARLVGGAPNLDDVLAVAVRDGRLPTVMYDTLLVSMRRFEATLGQWRQTHYRLAVRMLGDRSGTGYTQGTPYLKDVRRIRVFRSFDRDVDNYPTVDTP